MTQHCFLLSYLRPPDIQQYQIGTNLLVIDSMHYLAVIIQRLEYKGFEINL